MKSFLEKRNYCVMDASSGEEGVMKARADKPDLVFCDMRMPGMDGIMTLRQLRQFDETLKVVMLTSAQEEYIVDEAKKEGACDYLIKPCDFQKLDALITSLML